MLTVLALAAAAFASPSEDHLYWNVTLDDKPIGYRRLTVKWVPTEDGGLRRMLEMWTEVDATFLGFEYQFRERVTGTAHQDVAAFHAVSDFSGALTEVQARRAGSIWVVSTNYDGRQDTREWPATAIDVSTIDLVDPGSHHPLTRFEQVKVLSAETGDIYDGPVHSTGAGEISIGGVGVPVSGIEWSGDQGEGRFWYNTDGYLVRYELTVLGRRLVGTLREPPPLGPDAAPIAPTGGSVQEIAL